MASWDSTAFLAGRSDACGVCVWSYRLFASLDLTASWRGGLMQSNATEDLPFDRHKVVMDITFAAWYEVNIEFVEWLFVCVTLWMLCFVFRYVRKNVRRYVRKNVKRYVRKNFRRYVRKNVKRYVRKNAFSQSAKLRVTERISGDELYVYYPHLIRSG